MKQKQMNVLLWVLQIALAFWNITGALYMMSNYAYLANQEILAVLPAFFWVALGGLQIIFSVGLVLPKKITMVPRLTALSAVGLAVIASLGLVLYVAYEGFPGMLWGVIPAALAAFVAYKRWK